MKRENLKKEIVVDISSISGLKTYRRLKERGYRVTEITLNSITLAK
jgi:hypothetical protein